MFAFYGPIYSLFVNFLFLFLHNINSVYMIIYNLGYTLKNSWFNKCIYFQSLCLIPSDIRLYFTSEDAHHAEQLLKNHVWIPGGQSDFVSIMNRLVIALYTDVEGGWLFWFNNIAKEGCQWRGCAVSRSRYINGCSCNMSDPSTATRRRGRSTTTTAHLCNLSEHTIVKLCTLGVLALEVSLVSWIVMISSCVVVNKQFELLEFGFWFYSWWHVIWWDFLSILLQGVCGVCSPVVVIGLSVRLSAYPMLWMQLLRWLWCMYCCLCCMCVWCESARVIAMLVMGSWRAMLVWGPGEV